MCFTKLRGYRKGLIEIQYSFIEFNKFVKHQSQIIVTIRMLWIEGKGLVKYLYCLIKSLFVIKCATKAYIKISNFWIMVNCPLKIFYGFSAASEFLKSKALITIGFRHSRFVINCMIKRRKRI